MKIITSFSAILVFVSWTEATSTGGLDAPLPSKEKQRYVLNYEPHVDLDDLEDAIIEAGATLERQLTCTRGVVISIDSKGDGYEHLQSKAGFSMLPVASAHPTTSSTTATIAIDATGNHRSLAMNNAGSTCDFVCDRTQIACLTVDDVDKLKGMIKENLLLGDMSYAGSLRDSAGELVRLSFHDASNFVKGSGSMSGLNGCVDMSFGPNVGLQSSITFLEETRELSGISISNADLTVLGAIVAIEATGGPTITFHYGRIDVPCECQVNANPNPESQDARTSTKELDRMMRDQLGLTRRDITALLGSHSIGRLDADKSGYDGGWVGKSDRDTFDNKYYDVLLNSAWVKTEKNMQGKTLTEWKINFPGSDIIMLNTDAVLGFHIDGCDRFGGSPDTSGLFIDCLPRDDEYGRAVRDFAADKELWFADYVSAFVKMTEELVPCMQLFSPSMSKFCAMSSLVVVFPIAGIHLLIIFCLSTECSVPEFN
jgi:catalase (peroxidase I)